MPPHRPSSKQQQPVFRRHDLPGPGCNRRCVSAATVVDDGGVGGGLGLQDREGMRSFSLQVLNMCEPSMAWRRGARPCWVWPAAPVSDVRDAASAMSPLTGGGQMVVCTSDAPTLVGQDGGGRRTSFETRPSSV
jgi:hypothetical protein